MFAKEKILYKMKRKLRNASDTKPNKTESEETVCSKLKNKHESSKEENTLRIKTNKYFNPAHFWRQRMVACLQAGCYKYTQVYLLLEISVEKRCEASCQWNILCFSSFQSWG